MLSLVVLSAAAGAAVLVAAQDGLLERLLGPEQAPATTSPPSALGGMLSAKPLEDLRGPSRVVYLNREGVLLRSGADDAALNISSVVANSPLDEAFVSPFAGSLTRWSAIAKCIRGKFEPFDIQVVEQRPIGQDYIMAVLGGTPEQLGFREKDGHVHSHSTGLAPFNGKNIPKAVVFIFTHALRESLKETCEAASMEIAHAYGLDHARHCKDLMTYMKPCGARSFLDKNIPCGEHEDRPCQGGTPTQNSYRQLMELLGPRPKGRAME